MESIKRKQFNRYIENFKFAELFNQLGWNYVNTAVVKKAAEQIFNFRHIADKAGFAILICEPDTDGRIPEAKIRKKIHTEITKLHHEHLIVFLNKEMTAQQWELLLREKNKPARVISHKWIKGQAPELLYQKLSGAFFTMEEDEDGTLTIIDVVQRIKENFGANSEKITKKFYAEFKKHHTMFLDFISGIDDVLPNKENSNKQWYASLMLNRLMFCYFIQKKGFLDQDKNYLSNKLSACQKLSGSDHFYGFYRSFLLQLFHDGLGKPQRSRTNDSPVELGSIPYLNGGLFDVHELERQFEEININDEAFERIFTFFDNWEWHLDTREHAEGKTINPDVIGYIFEKYINDRAAMGAYYTKEDITDYIGKNTIIPFLFDETERKYKAGFKPDSELWTSLKNSGDKYIYEAVKHGIPKEGGLFEDLPDEIQNGFVPELEKEIVEDGNSPHLWELRKPWNRKAPEEIGLPTELYRELIERRKKYAEIKSRIEKGEVLHINGLITYNLNIRQFAQDFIEQCDEPDFIRHFYKALVKITILDPTCGSGAFLFAAMNILEPLYEACINRMEEFMEEQKGKYMFFEETLNRIYSDEHPNLQYFIFKSIILNNLYGVDIMKEAVEIAKLRLFLKLVSVVDVEPEKKNFGLEPLPDIDFNIRAGNTLVGFATEKELLETIKEKDGFFADEKLDEFKEEFKLVADAYSRFQDSQLISDHGSDNFRKAKASLQNRLSGLNSKLNTYLSLSYKNDSAGNPDNYQKWLESHQPFHWFAEFYRIVGINGGFDVIIGNPPYVEYSNISYSLHNYQTITCGNLYAFVMERIFSLINATGLSGMIIPHSSFCTDRMLPLFDFFSTGAFWSSTYDIRPGKLFSGVDQRLLIYIHKKNNDRRLIAITKYNRWNEEHRTTLFDNIEYSGKLQNVLSNIVLKASTKLDELIFQKC